MRASAEAADRHFHHALNEPKENSLNRYRCNRLTRDPSTALLSLRVDNFAQDDRVEKRDGSR
jgi:hypothetical protein